LQGFNKQRKISKKDVKGITIEYTAILKYVVGFILKQRVIFSYNVRINSL